MNSKDRELIAGILAGVTSDNTTTIVNNGKTLLELHPQIADQLDDRERAWWELPAREES